MKLKVISETLSLVDERAPEDVIFSGMPSLCYTFKDDRIQTGEKPLFTPYISRKDTLIHEGKEVWRARDTGASVCIFERGEDIVFSLSCPKDDIGEWGLELPFNFMGKKHGGGWRNQFLFNSPYLSSDRKIQYCYLTKPNGKHLLVLFESEADGWMLEYSPYAYGHFLLGLKCLQRFDRAYKEEDGGAPSPLVISLIPVNSFEDALCAVSCRLHIPVLLPEKCGGRIGERVRLKVYGKCDALETGGKIQPFTKEFTIETQGLFPLTPSYRGKRGADAVLYGYQDEISLWKASMDTVSAEDLRRTDGNLCEHQCWATAMLQYLSCFGANEGYEKKLRKILSVITAEGEGSIPRLTVEKTEEGYGVFRSDRIQEGFFGVSLLWSAYRYFGDSSYREYAVGLLDSLLRRYQCADGRIERIHAATGKKEDYSTVCCLMIPIVDMSLELRGRDDLRAARYARAASALAEYLYRRGSCFPTENEVSSLTESEVEEGSISCTALSLLYYCAKIGREEKYLRRAKSILDLHDHWVMHTPIAPQFFSTVRWWETIWEGDKDGPALCCGHAWTIWRAEADYWYGVLTDDIAYLRRAENGFLSNFAKIGKDGRSYACWQADLISGGGETMRSEDIDFRIVYGFPRHTDSGLSRYPWMRFAEIVRSGKDERFFPEGIWKEQTDRHSSARQENDIARMAIK